MRVPLQVAGLLGVACCSGCADNVPLPLPGWISVAMEFGDSPPLTRLGEEAHGVFVAVVVSQALAVGCSVC